MLSDIPRFFFIVTWCTVTTLISHRFITPLCFGIVVRSPSQEKDDTQLLHSAPEIRDVFGDSDDEEPAEYDVQNQIEEERAEYESNVCIRLKKGLLFVSSFLLMPPLHHMYILKLQPLFFVPLSEIPR